MLCQLFSSYKLGEIVNERVGEVGERVDEVGERVGEKVGERESVI